MAGNGFETIQEVGNVYQSKSRAFEKIQNLETPVTSMFGEADGLDLGAKGTTLLRTYSIDATGGPTSFFNTWKTPGANSYMVVTLLPKKMTIPVMIYKDLKEFTKSPNTAYGDAPAEILQAARDYGARMRELQAVGIGTGQIAEAVGAGTATTALICDDITQFIIGEPLEAFRVSGSAWVKVTTFALNVDNAPKVTDIDYQTNTVTLDRNATWLSGDVICKATTMDQAVYGNSMQTSACYAGLRGIVSEQGEFDDTFQNVNLTNYPLYDATVVDASGAPIAQDLLNQTLNRAKFYSGMGKEIDTLLSDRQQLRVFKNTELQKVRYEAGDIQAGAVKVMYDKFEWVATNDIYGGEVMLLMKDDIKWSYKQKLKLSPPTEGASPFTQISNTDAFSAYYTEIANLCYVGTKRKGLSRITNLYQPTK